MTVLPNIWAKLFFWASCALLLVGAAVFVKNVVRKDWEYEATYPWSLRGLVYLFSGTLWLHRGNKNRRKFALGLLLLYRLYKIVR